MGSSIYFNKMIKHKLANALLTAFFIVAFIEIIAEINGDKSLIWFTKPLLMPLLILYYLKRSHSSNIYFIIALIFSWIANMFFIANTYQWILYGSVFFLIYRFLIIYIVVKKVKTPGLLPSVIGSLPFVFIYFSVCFFTFKELGNDIYIFLLHGVFVTILGGLSLGNYILSTSKSNFYLFLSTMLFAITQFVFILKLFYSNGNLFHALAMVMFVFGQFFLTKFIFLTEKNRYNKYEIINDLKDSAT